MHEGSGVWTLSTGPANYDSSCLRIAWNESMGEGGQTRIDTMSLKLPNEERKRDLGHLSQNDHIIRTPLDRPLGGGSIPAIFPRGLIEDFPPLRHTLHGPLTSPPCMRFA